MIEEIWKPIIDYEGLYEVSDLGNIRNIKNGRNRSLKIVRKNRSGYYYVVLSKSNKAKTFYVHRLVALSFLENTINEGFVVDHINNIKTDNRLVNLQVITRRLNNNKDRIGILCVTGVHPKNGKYVSQITINKVQICIGYFKTVKIAKQHYELALLNMELFDYNVPRFRRLIKNKYNASIKRT